MKLPARVRITKRVAYDVLYSDDLGDNAAHCDPVAKQIVICNSQSKEEMVLSFIHEALHAIALENKIEIPHKSIYKLEKALLNLLRLNKWL